jgi:hypothetical protein
MALEDATNPMQGVSGPGSFSKRTDLQYQSPAYGDGVAYDAQKAGAPLAKSPDVRGATNTQVQAAAMAGAQSAPQDAVTSLYAPSSRPHEPITTGVAVGPGAGPEALSMGKATQKLSDILVKMLPFDTDGSIAVMYQNALARGN